MRRFAVSLAWPLPGLSVTEKAYDSFSTLNKTIPRNDRSEIRFALACRPRTILPSLPMCRPRGLDEALKVQ
jgi:hypothetical protein